MSKSGSVFRHGTLWWTYAPRSKQPLCLPQCIPNRSDKVPPLCDPDPLLIMDRLQNRPPQRPNWSCTQSCGLRSEESCGMLMNTHDMTCQLSSTMTASNRLGAEWSFSFVSVSPVKNVTVKCPCIIPSQFILITLLLQLCIYYNPRVCTTSKKKNNCQVLVSSFQLFDNSAEAAMQKFWFPSEVFLSLARETPHICDCSVL